MSDIFVSYAHSTAAHAQRVAEALRGLGYSVWIDEQLPAHRAYGEVIEERLAAAKAVLVIWSDEAIKSQWVRAEANRAREENKLVQLKLDGARLPLPFDQIQCADLQGWVGDLTTPGWRKVVASIAELVDGSDSSTAADAPMVKKRAALGNLPAQATSFVGREAEVGELIELLNVHRLVTLTGVGGVGKTRLALQVARQLTSVYPDGVWLVELAPVSDPAVVPDAISAALGITPQAGRTVANAVAEALSGRRLLVVLDNCEHVLDAAADVVETLLVRTQDVRVIATSREGLRVGAEHLWPVPSLDVRAGATSTAVALFIERARAVKPAFALGQGDAEAVTNICTRVDGIALAIELAAARMVSMNPQELLARLADRFRLLSGSRRGLERHQTLRHAVQWSYDLLTDGEKTLLNRCSVFAGSFVLATAIAVCGEGFDEYAIVDLLDSLVRKSLITVEQSGPQTRYGLLETIRQFAEEQMVMTGAVDDLRDRHARSFAEQAIAYWKIWDGPRQSVALDWLELEFANLRTGFRWATGRDDLVTAAAIAAHATMLGWALERYEPVEWALEILAAATRAEIRQLPRLYTAASFCGFLGQVEMAVGYAQTAQQLENDSAMDGFAREFSRLLEANAHLYADRTNRSLAIYQDVAALPEPANVSGLTGMLFALSSLGRMDEALALADRTLAAARLNGNPYWVAWSLWGYGQTLTTTDPARALNARRQGLIYSREHRLPFWEHLNAIDTASLETIHGEVGRGLELLDTVIDAFHRSGDVHSLGRSLDVLVVSLDHLGRSASAATIYGTGSRTLGGAPRLAKVANRLRDALGAQRFDECVASGAAMQPAESVRCAREQIELARSAIGKGS